MSTAFAELRAAAVPTSKAWLLVGRARATHYRHAKGADARSARPLRVVPENGQALTAAEWAAVLTLINSPVGRGWKWSATASAGTGWYRRSCTRDPIPKCWLAWCDARWRAANPGKGQHVTAGALFLAVFLACVVEAVEATTIVLAAGTARDWRSALQGVVGGLVVLAVIIAGLGPAVSAIPLGGLRLVVGAILLIFGLQWLRKAILRASGYKALHDEDLIFQTELAAARAADPQSRRGVSDWYAFTLSFKGVVLEGLEVAFIALTFGSNQHDIPLASIAAIAAVLVVAVAGLAVRAPLARVPENAMKFVVGIMLTSFGMFWGAEGAHAHWPGADAALLVLIPGIAVLALGTVAALRRRRVSARVPQLMLAKEQP